MFQQSLSQSSQRGCPDSSLVQHSFLSERVSKVRLGTHAFFSGCPHGWLLGFSTSTPVSRVVRIHIQVKLSNLGNQPANHPSTTIPNPFPVKLRMIMSAPTELLGSSVKEKSMYSLSEFFHSATQRPILQTN